MGATLDPGATAYIGKTPDARPWCHRGTFRGPVQQRNFAILACAVVVAAGILLLFREEPEAQDVAWTTPAGETLRAAAGSVAVTGAGDKLVGRDARTGAQRWAANVPGIARVQLLRDVVLVTGRDGGVTALDAGTGTARWSAAPVAGRLITVGSATAVAFSQCPSADRCVVESRALATGRITWTAPVARGDLRLGSPVAGSGDIPIWPTNHAIVPNPDGAGFNVRELDSGAIRLTDRRADREGMVLAGDVLVRSVTDTTNRTTIGGIDLATGGGEWSQTLDAAPLRADRALRTLAIADGSIVLVPTPTAEPRVSLADGARLRTMDPASGRSSATANELPDFVVRIVPAALSSGTPRIPVLATVAGDAGVQIAAKAIELDEQPSRVVATADQVGWRVDGEVTVVDRRGGRTMFEGEADDVLAVGDRVVVRTGDEQQVLAQRPE